MNGVAHMRGHVHMHLQSGTHVVTLWDRQAGVGGGGGAENVGLVGRRVCGIAEHPPLHIPHLQRMNPKPPPPPDPFAAHEP